jgi:hypothetical protein
MAARLGEGMTLDSTRRDAESRPQSIRIRPVVAIIGLVLGATALLSFDFTNGGFTPDFAFRLFVAGWIAAGLVALYPVAVLFRRRGTLHA